LKHSIPYDNAAAGGVVAVQTFGDFQNFNPHTYIIATDGCFYGDGQFMTANRPAAQGLEPHRRRGSGKRCSSCSGPTACPTNFLTFFRNVAILKIK
jgi:hypothetical protein